MGHITSKILWGGDPDEPNPISGLSMRDVYQIQKSWAPVYSAAKVYGMELFKRFFRADPETKKLFKFIKDADEAELSSLPQFQAHCINVMSSLNMAIINLNQPEVVIAMMHKLGRSHRTHRVPWNFFNVFKEVLVGFLVKDLKVSSAVLASWSRFVDFIYTNIFSKLEGN